MATRGIATQVNLTSSTTVVVTVSGIGGIGPQLHDLLLATLVMGGGGADTVTPPSGWSAIPGYTVINLGSGQATQRGYYKIATASEPTTYTFTVSINDFHSCLISCHSGRNITSPFTAINLGTPVASASPPVSFSSSGVTTATGDDVVEHIGVNALGFSGGQVLTYTPPSGFGNATAPNPTVSFSETFCYCDKQGVVAGPTGTIGGTLNNTGGGSANYAIIVMSLAAGVPVSPPVAFVKSVANSSNSNTVSFAPANTGDLLVVDVATSVGGGPPTTASITDNLGSFWQIAMPTTAVTYGQYQTRFYLPNCSTSINLITLTFQGGTPSQTYIVVTEYSGVALTNAHIGSTIFNQQTTPGTATDAVTSPTLNITSQPALIVGGSYDGGQDSFTVGTGYSLAYSIGTVAWNIEYKRTTSTGSAVATWTSSHGTGDNFSSIASAFAEASTSTGYTFVSGGVNGISGATNGIIPFFETFQVNDLIKVSFQLDNVSSAYVPQIYDNINSGYYINCFAFYSSSDTVSWGTSYIPVQNTATIPFSGFGTLISTSNVLTITSVNLGTLKAGVYITGTGLSPLSFIEPYGTGGTTGTGGTGTYQLSQNSITTEATPVPITAASCVVNVAYSAGNWSAGNITAIHYTGFTGTPAFDSTAFASANGSGNSISVSTTTSYANELVFGDIFVIGGGTYLPNGTPTGASWADTYVQSSQIAIIFTVIQSTAGTLSYTTTQLASGTSPWYLGLTSFYNSIANSAFVAWLA
jgi:hypothetical protein